MVDIRGRTLKFGTRIKYQNKTKKGTMIYSGGRRKSQEKPLKTRYKKHRTELLTLYK